MQYRIEHIAGWKNPAIIRIKDGVISGISTSGMRTS